MTMGLAVRAAAAAFAAALFVASPAAAVTLRPGDILIADDEAFGTAGCVDPDGCGGLILVDPSTGAQTAISNNAISPGNLFQSPTELALDPWGRVLMSQYEGSAGGNGSIVRVDPASGQATLVSDNAVSGPNLFVSPFGIVVDRSGTIQVADDDAFGGPGGVISVDPVSGQQTALSNAAISDNDFFEDPFGLGLSRAGRPLAADISAFGDVMGGVIQVDAGGQQTAISNNSISAADAFAGPLDVDPEGAKSLIVTDYQIDGGTGGLIRVDGAGQATVLSSNTISSTDLFDTPFSTAVAPDGRILVADEDSQGVGATGAVVAVDPSTGEQRAISNNTISGPNLFKEPDGIVIVPPRCGGRFANIVGTTGRDVIKGSKFADVIATLGGRDKVRGGGGADRICGGNGPDRLFGQGGRDRLFGQGGRDRLFGGKGRDRLRGGPGRDRLRGGPGRDRQKQ